MLTVLATLAASAAPMAFVAPPDVAPIEISSSVLVVVRQAGQTTLTVSPQLPAGTTRLGMLLPVPEVLGGIGAPDPALIDDLVAYSAPQVLPLDCPLKGLKGCAAEEPVDEPSTVDPPFGETALTSGRTWIHASPSFTELPDSIALADWLEATGMELGTGADDDLLEPFAEGMILLAAEVDLAEPAPSDGWLAPFTVAWEHEDFWLPLRIGASNGGEHQDLEIYTFTLGGPVGVGTDVYPNANIQSECLFSGDDFDGFYADRFEAAVVGQGGMGWVREFAWGHDLCSRRSHVTESVVCCECEPPHAAALDALGWEGDGWQSYLTRTRLRVLPAQVTEDLILEISTTYNHQQVWYGEYDACLEDEWELCDGVTADGSSAGCAAAGGRGVMIWGVIALAVARRRSDVLPLR